MQNRCRNIYLESDTPSHIPDPDATFGITPHTCFPNLIIETLERPWTHILYEYEHPYRYENGTPVSIRVVRAADIDERKRAAKLREARKRQ